MFVTSQIGWSVFLSLDHTGVGLDKPGRQGAIYSGLRPHDGATAYVHIDLVDSLLN